MAAQPIKVPDIGDFDQVEVIEVLVAAGDEVEQEQALITLESDKATLEVPSSAAGKITEMKVGEGDSVSEGDVIAMLEVAEQGDSGDGSAASEKGEDDSGDSGSGTRVSKDEGDAADRRGQDTDQDQAPQSGGGETVEVKVPDIGDFDEVEVIEALVSEGDEVEQEQGLITLESDKATLEVPSTAAGKIVELKTAEGDTVSQGDIVARVETAGDGAKTPDTSQGGGARDRAGGKSQQPPRRGQTGKDEPQDDQPSEPPAARAARPASATGKLDNVDEQRFAKAHASPSVRKYARQLGADLGRIQGSGRKGRILEEDVQQYVSKALEQTRGEAAGGVPAQPDIDFSQYGEVETVELSRIRKISAKAVHNNWLLIPHVTQFDTADITDMEAFRQANKQAAADAGVKLTPLAFVLKACAAALTAFPDLNSSLAADGEHLVRKHYCHIAVAVDTDNGLMMPVVRDVDTKGIYALAGELADVSERARAGKLKANEMKGACFSISSLGGVGGSAFTPIVNSPEVAILGVSKHEWRPVWQDGEFVPRLILPLSLSYDHRVIDGAKAARITGYLSRALGDLRTLLL